MKKDCVNNKDEYINETIDESTKISKRYIINSNGWMFKYSKWLIFTIWFKNLFRKEKIEYDIFEVFN